jgi:hypothetical protein
VSGATAQREERLRLRGEPPLNFVQQPGHSKARVRFEEDRAGPAFCGRREHRTELLQFAGTADEGGAR